MKLSYERKKALIEWSLTLLMAVLTVWLLIAGQLLLGIAFCMAFLVRFVFLSRKANSSLAAMRKDFAAALRNDQPYRVNRKKVCLYTLMSVSPIYIIWTVVAFLPLIGGFYGYLAIFLPTLVPFLIFVRLLLDAWHELELNTAFFWLMQLGAYLLTWFPMLVVALTMQ